MCLRCYYRVIFYQDILLLRAMYSACDVGLHRYRGRYHISGKILQKPNFTKKQECIPVGCLPTAAVAVCWGGVCLSACWDTPQVWAWRPPSPMCGPGDPPGQTPQLPPWVWGWRPTRNTGIPTHPLPPTPPRPACLAGIPPAMHAGIPPTPCVQNS